MNNNLDNVDLSILQFTIYHNLGTAFLYAAEITKHAINDNHPDPRTIASNAMEPYTGTITLKEYFDKLGIDTIGDWPTLDPQVYRLTTDDVFKYINGQLRLII